MPSTRRSLSELPALEGWMTFPEAAAALGISRQRMHQLAELVREDGTPELETASRLGTRPVYVIRSAEVRARKARGRVPAGARPAPPGGMTFGGVAVTPETLREAVAVLEATARSRGSFKQAMARIGSPLAGADHMAAARAYAAAHPRETAGMSTKQVLLAAFREALEGRADAA